MEKQRRKPGIGKHTASRGQCCSSLLLALCARVKELSALASRSALECGLTLSFLELLLPQIRVPLLTTCVQDLQSAFMTVHYQPVLVAVLDRGFMLASESGASAHTNASEQPQLSSCADPTQCSACSSCVWLLCTSCCAAVMFRCTRVPHRAATCAAQRRKSRIVACLCVSCSDLLHESLVHQLHSQRRFACSCNEALE